MNNNHIIHQQRIINEEGFNGLSIPVVFNVNFDEISMILDNYHSSSSNNQYNNYNNNNHLQVSRPSSSSLSSVPASSLSNQSKQQNFGSTISHGNENIIGSRISYNQSSSLSSSPPNSSFSPFTTSSSLNIGNRHFYRNDQFLPKVIPIYTSIPRYSYIPIYAMQAIRFYIHSVFSQNGGNNDQQNIENPLSDKEIWFESNGIPLKYQIPSGILYDISSHLEVPWKITIRFSVSFFLFFLYLRKYNNNNNKSSKFQKIFYYL